MEKTETASKEEPKKKEVPPPPDPMDSREWVDQMLDDLYGI